MSPEERDNDTKVELYIWLDWNLRSRMEGINQPHSHQLKQRDRGNEAGN